MRHKIRFRQLSRSPKHRKALLRNLATNLVEHERITTTLEKAKEVRPLVERLVHAAKRLTNADQILLKKILFKNSAIVKLREEIAPRFKDLPAGFTRIEYLGPRAIDKGKAAMIEFIGNEISEYQKNEE